MRSNNNSKATMTIESIATMFNNAELEEVDIAYEKITMENDQLKISIRQMKKEYSGRIKQYEEANKRLSQELDECQNYLKCLREQVNVEKSSFKTQKSLLEQELHITRDKVREQKTKIDNLEKQMIEKDATIKNILVEFEEFKLDCQQNKTETNDHIMRLEQEKAQIAKLVGELEKHRSRQGERALEFLYDNFGFICQNMTTSTSLADEIALTDSLEQSSSSDQIEQITHQVKQIDIDSNNSTNNEDNVDDINDLTNLRNSNSIVTYHNNNTSIDSGINSGGYPNRLTKLCRYTLNVIILIGISPFIICSLLTLYLHISNDYLDYHSTTNAIITTSRSSITTTLPHAYRYNELSASLLETISHIVNSIYSQPSDSKYPLKPI